MLDAHLGNGTSHRTAITTAPLLLTRGLVRYEAVLDSCGTSLVGRVFVSGSIVGVMVCIDSGRVTVVSNA